MTLRNNGISVKNINCNVATTSSSSSSSNSSTSNTTACGNKSNNTNNYFSNNNFCNENYSDNNFTCSGGNTRSSSSNHHHHYKSTKLNYQPHSQHQQSNNDKNMVNYELESHQQQSQQVNYHSHSQQHGHNNPVLNDMTNLTSDEKKKLEEIRIRRSKLLHEIQKLKEEISNVRKEMNHLDHTSTQNSPMGNNANSNDENSVQRAKQLSIGKKKFNMDPKKGIEFLVDNNLLKNMPEDVAKFLYKGEGLNKTAIGTYLGEKIDFNLNVLDSFIELHDFENLLLVQALRQFLWSFRLPGEAQKIDRMMEKFAARYCQQNPNVFSNTDTCFVLSFSIIMLNTSLHNPNVKDKMTADKFIVMNRGINNGGDLPRELLISLYDNIRQEPFKIPEDDGNDLMHTFFNPDREGWLWKQGGRYKSWKRRWFILNDKCLYYFEYTTDKEPRGIIPLENVDIREISDRGGRQHCFELYSAIGEVIKACKTDTEGRVIEGRHSVYRMSSATAEEKDAWVGGIRASVSYSPFYEMLSARKRKAQHNK